MASTRRRYGLIALSFVAILTALLVCIYKHDYKIVDSVNHAAGNNLRISMVKGAWATKYQATNGTVVTMEDLREFDPYVPDVCRSGGTIFYGKIGESATCTVHGNLENPKMEKTILFFKD